MLTTPARSDHSPPRPASAIGTAAVSAAPIVPEEVRSCAPVATRTAEITPSTPAAMAAQPHGGTRRLVLVAVAAGSLPTARPALIAFPRGPGDGWSCRYLHGWRGGRAQRPADVALLQPKTVAPDQLVGHHHRQADHTLHDGHDLLRHAADVEHVR